jgi:hypothetical protein
MSGVVLRPLDAGLPVETSWIPELCRPMSQSTGGDGHQVTAGAADGSETTAVRRLPLPPAEFDALLGRTKLSMLASSAVAHRAPTEDERPVQELGGLLFDALLSDRVRRGHALERKPTRSGALFFSR